MNRRTLRGQVEHNQVKRLIVDDGRLNHGYKVVKFVVFPLNSGISTNDVMGTLALDYDGAALIWDGGDNRQIGWAAQGIGSSRDMDQGFTLLDPDHIVIRDLYIYGSGSGDVDVNYLIELETVDLTDDQAILTLIKERSQDDLR